MGIRNTISTVAVVLGFAASLAYGDQSLQPIDLTSFGQIEAAPTAGLGEELGSRLTALTDPAENLPVTPVADGFDAPANRFYVSGIVGASFATINNGGSRQIAGNDNTFSGSLNDTIFTGGGAIGTAFTRQSGLLRMEVEGRARGPMSGQADLTIAGSPVTLLDVQATNNWSAMVNFWRDYFFTDAIGVYAGGGFGVGGYQYSLMTSPGSFVPLSGASTVTTFAWQAGTGIFYEINDRITLDTGYRFFAMTPDSTAVYINNSAGLGTCTSAFSASELLVSIRIYEPFRRWR